MSLAPRANLKEKVIFPGNPQPSSTEKHTSSPCLLHQKYLQSPRGKKVTTASVLFIGMGLSMNVPQVCSPGWPATSCLGNAVWVCATISCSVNHCEGLVLSHTYMCVSLCAHACHLHWKRPLSERSLGRGGLSQLAGLVCELSPALLFTSPKFLFCCGKLRPRLLRCYLSFPARDL